MSLSSEEQNRLSWNAATKAHNSHKGDQAQFLKDGGSTLFPEELDLLGDIEGKTLAHLQCNAGQDTLSLAKLGAVVTGVDISDEAISFAKALSEGSGIPGRFLKAEVLTWLGSTDERFDIVFASYGALCWVRDLDAWAAGVQQILKPGGRVVVIEFHPMLWLFEEDGSLGNYPVSTHGTPLIWEDGIGDYVAASEGALHNRDTHDEGVKDFANPHACHEFIWSESDIIGAVARSGLILDDVRDYPYSNGCKILGNMILKEGNRWHLPEDKPEMAIMLAFAAHKAGGKA